MKLLFDENLSFKLPPKISDIFPDSKHINDIGFQGEKDLKIWEFAKENNFIIVSKDSDFLDLINLKGFPPHLLWLRFGNSRVAEIEKRIRNNYLRIVNAINQSDIGIIQIR